MATETLTRITVRAYETDRARIQFVTLGETRVGLQSRYSAFDQRWRLWLLDLDGSQICGPITLVPGIDLLVSHKHDPRVPPGQLFVYSLDRAAPDAESMDATVALYYRST